jgi:hypothetical protein
VVRREEVNHSSSESRCKTNSTEINVRSCGDCGSERESTSDDGSLSSKSVERGGTMMYDGGRERS